MLQHLNKIINILLTLNKISAKKILHLHDVNELKDSFADFSLDWENSIETLKNYSKISPNDIEQIDQFL